MRTLERKVIKRPDGDLTIEGTSVWMPADLAALRRERAEVVQRLSDLELAESFMRAKTRQRANQISAHAGRGDHYREG